MKVRDAVCLVTGSAQGLGKAFAVRLLAAGAKYKQFLNMCCKYWFYLQKGVQILPLQKGVQILSIQQGVQILPQQQGE